MKTLFNHKHQQIISIGLFMLLLGITLSTAQASENNLPGGTAISLILNQPDHGLYQTANESNEPLSIPVSGTAAIGSGATNADTTLIYVLDASGSTEESSGLSLNCPDMNPGDADPGDPVPDENEIIDCEIAAAIALNEQAAGLGTIDEVAVIIFAGDAVTADATAEAVDTPLIHPAADNNGNDIADVDELLHAIEVAFLFGQNSGFSQFNPKPTPDIIKTDYADALREAGNVAAQSSNENIIIMFVSDGVNNAGSHVNQVLPLNIPDKSVTIHTFAIPDSVGFGGTCESDRDGLGSLQDIVTLQNSAVNNHESRCHAVADPSDLPDIVPGIIFPTLNDLMIQVDDQPAQSIDTTNLSHQLPQNGPVDVDFETAVSDLLPGEHDICVTAVGADAGGDGSITECITVTILSPAQMMDFGDAPDLYATTFAENGARHLDYSMEWLGATVDGEADALNNDLYDDGVRIIDSNYPNRRMFVTISTSGLGAKRYGVEPERRLYLQVWIDYNQDGDWDDEGELAVLCDVAPGTRGTCNGKATNWRNPNQPTMRFPIVYRLRSTNEGPTWVRARLTYGEQVGPIGTAQFGEVEDYEDIIFLR